MAKEFYGYFDSLVEDEREYDAAQFAHILRAGMVNGVTSHAGGGLQVTTPGTGMTTQVSPGGCVVNGYLFVLEDDGGGVRSFSHQPSAASDRWDSWAFLLRLPLTRWSSGGIMPKFTFMG